MLRHIGGYVYDIEKVANILLQLGFRMIYNEIEVIGKVKKFIMEPDSYIELIEIRKVATRHTWHISIGSCIPNFMKKDGFVIKSYKPSDPGLLVDFVYINDLVYFEFVRNKN